MFNDIVFRIDNIKEVAHTVSCSLCEPFAAVYIQELLLFFLYFKLVESNMFHMKYAYKTIIFILFIILIRREKTINDLRDLLSHK